MGNTICVDQNSLVTNKTWEFVRKESLSWDLSSLIEARSRFNDLLKENPSHLVPRRIFWEIFSDYTTESFKANNCKFLSLSLELYPLFEIRNNKENINSSSVCDIREVFCILALLLGQVSQTSSNSSTNKNVSSKRTKVSLSKKFEFLFPFYGDEMSISRVSQLIGCITRALFNLQVMKIPVNMNEIQEFSKQIFSSVGHRKYRTISAQLLSDFFLTREEFNHICSFFVPDAERKSGKLNTLSLKDSDKKKKMSKMRTAVKTLLEGSELLQKRKVDGQKSFNRRTNILVNSDGSGKGNSSDFVLQQQLKKLHQQQVKRDREQAKARKARKQALREIRALTGVEFRKLRSKFSQIKQFEKGIPRDKFAEVLAQDYEQFRDRFVTAQLFKLFDRNNDGFVTFIEFVIGVLKMKAERMKDKISFLYVVFAVKRKGRHEEEVGIKLVDLINVVQCANIEIMECASLVELLITMMDEDKNGEIDKDEFLKACLEIPPILDCFNQCLSPTGRIRPFILSLKQEINNLSTGLIFNLWQNLGSDRENWKDVSHERFIKFLSQVVDSVDGEEQSKRLKLAAVRRIGYDLFSNADKSSSDGDKVDLRRFLVGTVLVLSETEVTDAAKFESCREEEKQKEEDRIMFYFNLFDVDESETVEYNEFFEMLYAAQLSVQDTSWQAVEVLKELDSDGNGIITEDELLNALKENDLLFECFARIFCAEEDENDENAEKKQPHISVDNKLEIEHANNNKQSGVTGHLKLPLAAEYRTTYDFIGESLTGPTASQSS